MTDAERHYFEVSFLFHLLGSNRNSDFEPLLNENPDYLVTGFCLGMQTMNVATGGRLYQDIPAQLYESDHTEKILNIERQNLHRNYWQNINNDPSLMRINMHPVHFTQNPFFGKTIKLNKNLKPLIYSSHHQSVKKIGDALEVTAVSPDGKVIEGLAHTIYPNVFSVQFHPEVREKWKFNPGDKPKSLHQMMNRKSIRFHKKYWLHISRIVQ